MLNQQYQNHSILARIEEAMQFALDTADLVPDAYSVPEHSYATALGAIRPQHVTHRRLSAASNRHL